MTGTTERTLDIRRVPSARQPYRRNGYGGSRATVFYWCVVDESGRTIDTECTLGKARAAVAEMGARVGRIIREAE